MFIEFFSFGWLQKALGFRGFGWLQEGFNAITRRTGGLSSPLFSSHAEQPCDCLLRNLLVVLSCALSLPVLMSQQLKAENHVASEVDNRFAVLGSR